MVAGVAPAVSQVRLQLQLFLQIVRLVLYAFWLLLIARVVVEFIRSFARDWHPKGLMVVLLELIFTLTDPPVKLFRRLIPQLTIGAVRFDLSIMVLLLLTFILIGVVENLALASAGPAPLNGGLVQPTRPAPVG